MTAQRRSEPLQNVPIAVSAATAAQLASTGISSTQELTMVIPGLSTPQAAGYTQPHIRGVGSSTNGPGLEQPVATYIDGVYLASAPASLLTLNNVDRIEVLKGPQGTLFGRNATGGLIQIVTKDPKHDPSVTAEVTYANYGDIATDLYLTGGLTDTIAADMALRYEHQNAAWGHDFATGDPIGQLNHDFADRVKFLFEPSDGTAVRLALDYEDRVSSRDVQHLNPQYPGTFNNAHFGGPFPMGGPYDISSNLNLINKLKAGGVSLQVNQDLGNVSFESITAYRESRFSFLLDIDLTAANILQIFGVAKDAQFSQEFQLTSRDAGRVNWVAGVYYFYADDRWEPLDIGFGPSVASPIPGVPVAIDENDRQITNSVAGYAQGTYELASDTHLTLGVRETYERKSLSGSSAFSVAGTTPRISPIPAPGGIPASIDFQQFNYRVALDHKFTPNVMGYVSYNTGFKSGGYNLAVPANAPYAPEAIGAAEVGLKTEFFDHHLRLNGAAYDYNYKNIQVGRYFEGNESIYNGARAKIYGLDFDGEVVLMQGFSINGGFSYNHTRFASFPLADYIVPVGGCVPPVGGVCSASATGKVLPFSPSKTFNVGGNYKVETAIGAIALNVTYFRTSRFYAAPDNIGYQPAYGLINANVGWTDLSGHYSLNLWGKNLGDTVYATSLIEGQQGLIDALGAPRTYGITAGVKF